MKSENGGGARILIVDDNPRNLGLLFDYLVQNGFVTLVSQSGEDALDLVEETVPDIILMDILMPGMGGFAACRELKRRKETRDVPVIFISSLSETVDKIKGFEAGGVDYITKPFQQEEALARILTHLNIRRLKIDLERQNERLAGEIRERRKMEAELQQAKEAAESASSAKSEFLANMSHEIRTPMNAILGFTDLLESMVADEQQKSYLHAVKASAGNLMTLINDILDLSKIEAGKMDLNYGPVNFRAAFEEVRQVFSLPAAEKNLQFIVDVSAELPEAVLFDEVRLRQILLNLAGNAVKFTESGHVRLSARPDFPKTGADRMDVVISVEDTGVGVPPEARDRIFEAFSQQQGQSTRKYGGTGLGLAITKRLTEMMNGRISLRGAPGKGSVFTVAFRDIAVAEASERPAAGPAAKDGGVGRKFTGGRVLVADDSEFNRALMKALLRKAGLQVTEAENGEAAVTSVRERGADLALMDISMPVMDGYEATRRIKENPASAHIPVIALTALTLDRDRENILQSGFDGILIKPVQRAEVYQVLSRHFQEAAPEPEAADDPEPPALTDGNGERLGDLVRRLEQKHMAAWRRIRERGAFDDIKSFGALMQTMGKERGVGLLERYGTELLTHADLFDIEEINAGLDAYPALVEKLKAIQAETGRQ